jgi:ketosteroid isomerase-like protein
MPDKENGTGTAAVFLLFVAAINRRDVEALAALMAEIHLFVDSAGNRAEGSQRMKAGWSAYFAMCPDYWIHIDQWIEKDGTVLAVGEAGGTIDGTEWRVPAAWKAVIEEGKVAEWRVFADIKPVYEIVARRQRGESEVH